MLMHSDTERPGRWLATIFDARTHDVLGEISLTLPEIAEFCGPDDGDLERPEFAFGSLPDSMHTMNARPTMGARVYVLRGVDPLWVRLPVPYSDRRAERLDIARSRLRDYLWLESVASMRSVGAAG